jgi:uncharacterized phage protein gp47/JayE
MSEVIINVPTEPEEFGIVLPSSDLRRINFSALDFVTLRRSLVEYIKTYFPDDFNDFVSSNGAIMFMELVAASGNILSQRADILSDEAFLPTAQSKDAVINHLSLINQTFKRATPATVDVEISISNPISAQITIPSGLQFIIPGADGSNVTYELYRAPNDYYSGISIPIGKRGIIAFGIEGRFATPVVVQSAGGSNQSIEINGTDILDDPIFVDVATGSSPPSRYIRVTNIEKYYPNDEVFEVKFLESSMKIVFGDDINGKAPLAGQTITVTYRTGGGLNGRIGSNIINESRQILPNPPASAPVDVLFRNIAPSVGGYDDESIEDAKKRAPKDAATLGSATSGEDYSQLAKSYIHPVFGSVLKAVSTVRSGVEQDLLTLAEAVRAATTSEEAAEILGTNFINKNIIEVYALANGSNDTPSTPSAGLKQGLQQYFSEISVLTDEVRILDGAIKSIDFTANVIVNRSADAGTVKESVSKVIDDFFNIDNFDMGQGLYISRLYETIQNVPGVKFVKIFSPADDIIPTKKIADEQSVGVGFNELITLGEKKIQFFFEKGSSER